MPISQTLGAKLFSFMSTHIVRISDSCVHDNMQLLTTEIVTIVKFGDILILSTHISGIS